MAPFEPREPNGTGSTNVSFTFDVNPGATRSGTLTVDGLPLTVTQAGATYAAAPFITLFSYPQGIPTGVAVDGAGNVYFADYHNSVINEWSATTGTVTSLVSTGLSGLFGVALDSVGNVYFDDKLTIEEWSATNGTVTTLASSKRSSPNGVAVDLTGNVYFSDDHTNTINKWLAPNGPVTTLVSAGLNTPTGVAVDGSGNVYFADYNNSEIKEWSPASGTVSVIANASEVLHPWGVAVDAAGKVYIGDESNHQVEEVPRAYLDSTPKTEPVTAGSDVLPVVLPATENQAGVFAPTADTNQPWLTISGVANGVVSYAFTANPTLAPRTAHLTVLGQSISITQAGAAAPTLSSPARLPGGSFQFSFTGTPGASYTVWFTTNLALTFSAWTAAGSATVTTPGQFQFTATPAPGTRAGFYRVTSPWVHRSNY